MSNFIEAIDVHGHGILLNVSHIESVMNCGQARIKTATGESFAINEGYNEFIARLSHDSLVYRYNQMTEED